MFSHWRESVRYDVTTSEMLNKTRKLRLQECAHVSRRKAQTPRTLLLFSRKNGFSEAARSVSARIGLLKSRKSVHRFEQVNQRGNVQYFSQPASDEPLRLDDHMSRQQSIMPTTILWQSITKKWESVRIQILEGLPKSCQEQLQGHWSRIRNDLEWWCFIW